MYNLHHTMIEAQVRHQQNLNQAAHNRMLRELKKQLKAGK